MSRKIRVAVLSGGQSAEHEISLESARTILGHLDSRRYEALSVRIGRDGQWLLENSPGSSRKEITRNTGQPSGGAQSLILSRSQFKDIDVVIPALHGPMGEDGTIQGFLELAHLPYVGCGVLASSVGMDKDVSKRLAAQAGIPVLPHVLLRSPKDLPARRKALRALGLPVFVKPVRLGSSVGITKVKNTKALARAVRGAFLYDTKVMVEKGVDAVEICCAVLGAPGGAEASICGEVEVTGTHEFFDYQAKYFDDSGHALHIPARLSAQESRMIREFSLQVFEAFEGHGMARVDFFVERRSRALFFGEINTIPGFTGHSLYPKLWEASGLPISALLDRLIALALTRHKERSRLRLAP